MRAVGRSVIMVSSLWWALWIGALLTPTSAVAQQQGVVRSEHSSLALQATVETIQPGVPFTVVLRVTLDPGWHTYWINPGDSGLPFVITWELPAGFTVGPLRWPPPQVLPYPPLMSYGFERELVLTADMTAPASTPTDRAVRLRGSTEWLVCADVCLPAAGHVDLTLPVRASPPIADNAGAARVVAARARAPRGSTDWRLRLGHQPLPALQPPGRHPLDRGQGRTVPDQRRTVLFHRIWQTRRQRSARQGP